MLLVAVFNPKILLRKKVTLIVEEIPVLVGRRMESMTIVLVVVVRKEVMVHPMVQAMGSEMEA